MKIDVLYPNTGINRGEKRNYFSFLKTLSVVFSLFTGQFASGQTAAKATAPLTPAATPSVAIGTWTQVVTNAPHDNMGIMILMTDGSVMIHNSSGGGEGKDWDRLTPNAQGSYVNGTWNAVTPGAMHEDRLFFASQVLPNGELWVAGGEYGAGDTAGEVYNPVTNVWTRCEKVPGTQYEKTTGTSDNIYDGNSEILPNGQVLVGPQIGPDPSNDCLYFNNTTNNWVIAPTAPLDHDEAQWLKLPDSSILFVGIDTKKSCRFRPQTNTWIENDNAVPVPIFDPYGEESGCATLLPNGKAIFFGATDSNAFYTPSGNANGGTWSSAPLFPTIQGNHVGQTDAPGAMMVNGHELLAVSPIGIGTGNEEFRNPVWFLEYDYVSNTFVQVTSNIPGLNTDSIAGVTCNFANFLDLPNGQVLMGIDQESISKEYWVYTPGSAEIPEGIPTINSILPDGCPLYKITGKLFNGISEGATFGDDWQNSTNYPLVRCTNAAGDVYYCKTTNWNRIGAVVTDSLEDTAVFTTTSLPAGTYSLVVVVNGFPSNPTIFTTLQGSIASHTNVDCNGGSTGTATFSVTGGISPYTYAWTASGGSATVGTGLSAGTYTITVKDYNDCSTTATVTITQPAAKVATTATVTAEASCSGNVGSASSTTSGGTSPYTYAWTGGITTANVSGLGGGTYTLSVTDNNGCTASVSVTITQSSTLDVTPSTTANVKCNGTSDGGVTVTVSGGVTPYTYSWTGGGATASVSSLSAGTYTISVTDHSGCIQSSTTIITQPTLLDATTSVTANTNCGGNNGSVSSTVSGGVSPYTYSWTGGATTPTVTGLSAGSYTLSVNDKNGCAASASVTITQSTTLSGVSASTTSNINCNGSNDGIASSAATGGTAPYTYSWTGGGGTSSISNLSAGTYVVTITDKNGCSGTASASITQPANALSASGSVTANASCGGITGSASSSVSGGTSPYTYSWTGGATTPTVTGLSAGTYTLSVNDNNGCSQTTSVTIIQTTSLSSVVANTTENVKCKGTNDGTITATVSGGASPYTYSWTGGATTTTVTGLSAGTYNLSVTDKNGCTGTATTTITQPANALSASGSVTANASCGSSTGAASSTVNGGISPYTYAWTGGATTPTISGLSAGTYYLTVSDNNGCTQSASVTISQASGLSSVSATTTTNVKCSGLNDGIASSTISGGTSPFTYSWTGGKTTANISGLSAGIYTLTVTDKNGCSGTATTTISSPNPLGISSNVTANVNCDGNTGSASSTVTGGTAPYTYSWTGGATTPNINGLSAGTYVLNLTDNNGCTASSSVTITQTPALSVSANTTVNVECNGYSDGSASSTISGGASPYTYSWTGGGVTSTDGGLSAGTYILTTTDHNGCSGTAEVVITQPIGMIITVNAKNSSAGACNGAAEVTDITGGTPPYTYKWNNTAASTTDTIKNECSGDYCCTVTDHNGCTQTTCVTVDVSTTGIANVSNVSNINIYPDPNIGSFTVAGVIQGQIIQVYSDLGQQLSSVTADKTTMYFDISDKANGIYLIRILNKDGSFVTQKKIVKTQ